MREAVRGDELVETCIGAVSEEHLLGVHPTHVSKWQAAMAPRRS